METITRIGLSERLRREPQGDSETAAAKPRRSPLPFWCTKPVLSTTFVRENGSSADEAKQGLSARFAIDVQL